MTESCGGPLCRNKDHELTSESLTTITASTHPCKADRILGNYLIRLVCSMVNFSAPASVVSG